ncbi:MAG TPA: sigma-70 family RNA polymerase sigma factor [Solirubrobacterales bacterium]|jgi:RNA polymerase sigma factor (sigma-70 family)|nr:sigma-70 family RNA polymerase sigma factor [Solirubrobacterales bacterium]
MPPPASGLSARLVLGPALRAQSDRRLVRLVRDGYESAFEEIVRRYRRPLDRFAASIVGGRSEDVTQDSFRKALVAMRDGEGELELRPWLYRIVRNTALNDLRDRPPAAAELAEDLVGGGRSAAVEAEQREDMAVLTTQMLALPAKQRAALVMRELEGMGHEEIAAALGVSGGAARQAIARGRATVRAGFGALVPLPLVRALAGAGDGATEAAIGGGAVAAGASGLGAGALKVGFATVVVAGSIGAGVAVQHHEGHRPEAPQAAASAPAGSRGDRVGSTPSLLLAEGGPRGASTAEGIDVNAETDSNRHDGRGGDGRGRRGHEGGDLDRADGHRRGRDGDDASPARLTQPVPADDHEGSHRVEGSGRDGSGSSERGSGRDDSGRGGGSGRNGSGDDGGSENSGSGGSGRDGDSGSGGPGSGDGSQRSGSTGGGRGSDDAPAEVVGTTPTQLSTSRGSGSSSPGSGSSSGGSGSSGGGPESSGDSGSSSGGSDTATASPSTSGSSGGAPSPSLDSTTDGGSHSGGGPDSSETSEISP